MLDEHLDRFRLQTGGVEHGQEVGVPVSDGVEQADDGQDRLGHRQDHFEHGPELPGAVDPGRVDELAWDGRHEEGAQDDEVPGAEAHRQDQRPHLVEQSQVLDHEVGGVHAGGEQHRDEDEREELAVPHRAGTRESIGRADRQGQADRGAHGGQQQREQQRSGDRAAREDLAVGLKAHLGRQEHHVPAALQERLLGRDTRGEHRPQRDEDRRGVEKQEQALGGFAD